MSELVLPDEEKKEPKREELKYKATRDDDECFFLMYHMNMAPSEVKALDPDYRKWIIHKFLLQKHMEQEMMERQQLMNQIGGNLRG